MPPATNTPDSTVKLNCIVEIFVAVVFTVSFPLIQKESDIVTPKRRRELLPLATWMIPAIVNATIHAKISMNQKGGFKLSPLNLDRVQPHGISAVARA